MRNDDGMRFGNRKEQEHMPILAAGALTFKKSGVWRGTCRALVGITSRWGQGYRSTTGSANGERSFGSPPTNLRRPQARVARSVGEACEFDDSTQITLEGMIRTPKTTRTAAGRHVEASAQPERRVVIGAHKLPPSGYAEAGNSVPGLGPFTQLRHVHHRRLLKISARAMRMNSERAVARARKREWRLDGLGKTSRSGCRCRSYRSSSRSSRGTEQNARSRTTLSEGQSGQTRRLILGTPFCISFFDNMEDQEGFHYNGAFQHACEISRFTAELVVIRNIPEPRGAMDSDRPPKVSWHPPVGAG